MRWSSLSWKWIPPGTPRTSLGLPRPPAPLGPPPSVPEQRRLIPWVPDEEPRFAGNSVMEQAMTAAEGLRDMQWIQRQTWNALLGVDHHAELAMHALLQAHTLASSDADPTDQEQIRQLHLGRVALMNIRLQASRARRDQRATILATEHTRNNLEDCAANVVCTCAQPYMNR